jgi:hypothetical protein
MSSPWRRAPTRPWPLWGATAVALGLLTPGPVLADVAGSTSQRTSVDPGAAQAVAAPLDAAPLDADAVPALGVAPALGSPGAPELGPRTLWRFGSASPVSGAPAVSPSGLVYVTSVEGFVHALDAGGSLRWSYGLAGIPIGAPIVDATSQVYVATTAPRLYALRSDGRLSWMLRVRTRFATPPIWASPGLLYYHGRDQNLYSVPTWGSQPHGRYLGQAASVALGGLGAGLVALSTPASEAQIYRRSGLVARVALDGVPSQPLFGGAERWFAPTRAGITAYDGSTRARLWSTPGQHAAVSADEKALIVASGRELFWLSPETGEERLRMPLPDDVSAPPVLTNAGVALVPLVSGELLLMDAATSRVARVHVAPAPVWSPVWSELSQRVTAAAGGVVVALDLSAWSPPHGSEAGSLVPARGRGEGA